MPTERAAGLGGARRALGSRLHGMWQLASLSAITASMHTVFSTECTSYFDWQSVGVFYSHQEVLQPGYITRLMACDHPAGYAGANIGPTHVHPNYGNPKNNHVHDRYTPYNKPGALQHWLDSTIDEPDRTEPPPEYVLVVDPDTIFRKPIDCHRELGVRPGVVASSPRPYLEGVDNGMAAQFVSPEAVGRIDKVCHTGSNPRLADARRVSCRLADARLEDARRVSCRLAGARLADACY